MRIQSSVGITLATCALLLAVSESVALALPCNLSAPTECATLREQRGYSSGVSMGKALVDQIWRSPAVNQQIDNWDILHQQVTVTIPGVVTSAYVANPDQYTRCRIQGLLDGTVCEMNTLDPIPGCQLNGADWGGISSAIYCGLSIALDGLADMPPWFNRYPVGMCGSGFQTYCDDTFRYGATSGADSLSAEVLAFLAAEGVNPAYYLQPAECGKYTQDPFAAVFEDSVYVDCSYLIPPL